MTANTSRSIQKLPRRNRSVFLSTALLALSFLLPQAMGQKGKPGGGGGGGGGGPSTVPAPVEYQVAWLEWPEANTYLTVEDVNSAGYVVGWCRPDATGKNIGIVMHPSGIRWNLNDVFAASLQSQFPGWRYNGADQINEAGMVAGVLVPDEYWGQNQSPHEIVVVGNIFDPVPVLHEVDRFMEGDPRGSFNNGLNLNENGDTVLWVGGESLVYIGPTENTPPTFERIVRGPSGTSPWGLVSMNDNREVAGNTRVIVSTKGRSTTYAYPGFIEYAPGVTRELGVAGLPYLIAADGAVYAGGSTSLPSRWSPLTGSWSPIASSGRTVALSKAPAGSEELLINDAVVDGRTVALVHREGLGAFVVNVTSGQNGQADLDRLYAGATQPFRISSPTATGSGCLAGEGPGGIYLLTPVAK